MLRSHLVCGVVILLLCGVFPAPALADESTRLRQENARLQRQVKRLESQVAALREELNATDPSQVIGGLGYIVGIFGVAAWIATRKQKRREG